LGGQVGLAFDLKDALIFNADGKRQRRVEVAISHPREVA
jgi:hypothetical protein